MGLKIDTFISKVQNTSISVSTLLREAKLLAKELDLTDVPLWVNLELNGYREADVEPEYREIRGQMKAWNPYYGWVPVMHKTTEVEDKLCVRTTRQSIDEIEELLKSDSQSFEMPYDDAIAHQLIQGTLKPKVSLFIGRTSLTKIVESVRNNLFDWAMNLNEEENVESGEIKKEVGGMRLPGGIALGPLMFSRDGKKVDTVMGPAIIPFDYGITNSLNALSDPGLKSVEFQTAFNSQVEDLVAEMLIYFQNRLKPIKQGSVGQFNSIDKCVQEYTKVGIDLGKICNLDLLLDTDRVRGRKHHSDRRYDSDYTVGDTNYNTVELLRELNRSIHREIHVVNDALAETHPDYEVEITQTDSQTTITFKAISHAFNLEKGGRVVPKKDSKES